jgi:hypothetical protein
MTAENVTMPWQRSLERRDDTMAEGTGNDKPETFSERHMRYEI